MTSWPGRGVTRLESLYLVDFAQKTHEPLPDQYDHGGLPEEEVGVIEARTPRGARFGIDRLADLATQHSSEHLEPEEIVRHLI
ncbi:MAG: hypothetical protein ACRD0E_08155, partial [Acidimicrobiales bacterium]